MLVFIHLNCFLTLSEWNDVEFNCHLARWKHLNPKHTQSNKKSESGQNDLYVQGDRSFLRKITICVFTEIVSLISRTICLIKFMSCGEYFVHFTADLCIVASCMLRCLIRNWFGTSVSSVSFQSNRSMFKFWHPKHLISKEPMTSPKNNFTHWRHS